MYNKRKWLNKNTSDSTGSVVCFAGKVKNKDKYFDDMFIEIADCRNKIRLHITDDDTKKDFINKLKTLNKEIINFIDYLSKT
jgi:molybdopterin synthase catalytic subunit